jgi:hypothetical protein
MINDEIYCKMKDLLLMMLQKLRSTDVCRSLIYDQDLLNVDDKIYDKMSKKMMS